MAYKQRIPAAFNVLVVFVVTLVVLLIVHAWIYSELTYSALPFAEPWLYHLIIVGMLALASTVTAMLIPGRRGIFYSMLAPFVVYLGWAVVQQNLIGRVSGRAWRGQETGHSRWGGYKTRPYVGVCGNCTEG